MTQALGIEAENPFNLPPKLLFFLNTVNGLNLPAFFVKEDEHRVGDVVPDGEGLPFGCMEIRQDEDGVLLKFGYERVHDPL